MSDSETPDYTSSSDRLDGADPGRQRRIFVLTLVLVPIIAIATAFAVSRSGDDDVPAPPSVVAPASPIDGKESQRLPVRVTPDTGIVDSQLVTVTGSGFPANEAIAIVMCTNAAQTRGVDACDVSTSTAMNGVSTTTTSEGLLQAQYQIRRFITIAGETVDCAQGNVDPADYQHVLDTDGPFSTTTKPGGFTCIIAAAVLSDYDRSGGWPIAFEGAQLGPGAPTPTTPVITEPDPPATFVEPPDTGPGFTAPGSSQAY